jgi:ABC-type multidrug transport system ATPase subunit/ABC-type multidrug transport system permease subunit
MDTPTTSLAAATLLTAPDNVGGGDGALPAVHRSHVELRFSELGFKATVAGEEKQVLKGVSGSVSSGEFLAVMGPSGSGKTTFLDVLARRKLKLKACQGDVFVNGSSVDEHVRSYSGGLTEFVPQQDTLLPVHTVTEMLRFVADLKLPATMSSAEKDERVREAIAMVGLEHRASAYIGSNLVRGLSGGERRRAMIAAALVPRPPVLFLDEPTSGLSSTDALRVVEMLGNLAKSHGYAVIAVVHQPQSRLFSHFDKLLLLSQGEVCYMGSALESVPWFENATATTMPSAMNPADWLLDIVTPGFLETDTIAACQQQVARERDTRSSTQIDSEHTPERELPPMDLSKIPEFATGGLRQFRVVAYRCFQAKVRHWRVLLIRLGVNLFVAVIAGSALPLVYPLYVHANTQEPSRLINAVLFFVVTFEGLIALTVLPLFTEERELFSHERKAKLYRVFPYFLANLSAEAVVQCYSSLIFGATFYMIVRLSNNLSRFGFYLIAVVLVGDCASAFAQLCSSASRNIVNSLALCAMGLGSFLLFSGFLVLPSSIPFLWKPLYHLSFWKYGFQALTINEFSDNHFPCESLNYSMASQCPPFGYSEDCPLFPCYNTSSGHAAAVNEYRRFKDVAEVHNAFLTSDYAGMFLGAADSRQINCRMLCGPEEAPGRYDGDDCVCTAFVGCRNDTSDCDPILWKDNRGSCPHTRHLNGVPANGSCAPEVKSIAGEYFLDALGFGRLDAKGKPDPENDPDITHDAQTGFVCIGGHCSARTTQYVWLGGLLVIMTGFRVLNFVLLLIKRD